MTSSAVIASVTSSALTASVTFRDVPGDRLRRPLVVTCEVTNSNAPWCKMEEVFQQSLLRLHGHVTVTKITATPPGVKMKEFYPIKRKLGLGEKKAS